MGWRDCVMNLRKRLLLVGGLFGVCTIEAATTANQFLRYVYGAKGVAVEQLCWPNDDLWMVHGRPNPAGLAELEKEPVNHGANEVVWAVIQNAHCIVEVRDGKVDPAFLLDQIHFGHRRLVLQFIYAALRHDTDMLKDITTQGKNVDFGRTKPAAQRDLDVYEDLIASLPVVRSSAPAADKVSHSVTYRVPLGAKGFAVRLVRRNGAWLVDTDVKLTVPLEFFYR